MGTGLKRAKEQKEHRFYRAGPGAAQEDVPTQAFIALVPGMFAPLLSLDLPETLRGQARERVARLQISDSIGLDPQRIEFRPFAPKPHQEAWAQVILTQADQVARWRADFGPACQAILPDYLSLPVVPGVWTLATTQETTIARLGLEDGFSAEHGLALAQLEKVEKPQAVFRLGSAEPALDDFLQSLDVPVCRSKAALADLDLPAPQVLGHGELQFDLAKNPMAAFDQMTASLKAWRLPVLFGVLGLGFWSLSMGLGLREIQDLATQVRQATVADVRAAFVPVGPILDVRTQVSQALARRQHAAGQNKKTTPPMALFKAATQVFDRQGARVTRVNYTPLGGLSVMVLMPDFSSLEQVVKALERADIAVDVSESSSAESGGVQGSLILRPKEQETP